MNLTDVLKEWVDEAERMDNGPARAVIVSEELWSELTSEQASDSPAVAGLPVYTAASEGLATDDGLTLDEMVGVAGPDRIVIYVGKAPGESSYPVGYDPAMPVFLVPVPPATLADGAQLEMYNRLRWIGIGPEDTLAGSGQ